MRRYVLDSSAVMAFFENRPGAVMVEELLGTPAAGQAELLMSSVNWGEVIYSTWNASGAAAAQRVLAELEQLPIEAVPADRLLAEAAAEMKAKYKLPYADGFAAALAQSRQAAVVTEDRDFHLVDGIVPVVWIK